MNYHYDSQQRLTSITGANAMTFSYDAYGNVTGNGAQSFSYNRAGNMVSSTSPSVSYAYDGHKRRVQRTEGGQTTYTMYSQSGQLLHKQAGGVSTDYIYAGQMLVATKSGSTVNYVHTDLLGSPIDGRVGSTSYTENYSPWGEKLDNPVQLAGDVGYTGHQADVATGLTYMQARYYDPVVGRFMAVDPVGFTPRHPYMFNRYAYAANNPLTLNDPDGRCPWCIGAGVGAAVEAVAIRREGGDILSAQGIGRILRSAAIGAIGGGAGGQVASWGGKLAGAIGRRFRSVSLRSGASNNARLSVHPAISGAAAGALSGGAAAGTASAVNQVIETGSVDAGQVIKDAGRGALFGAVAGGVAGGVQAHRASAIHGDSMAKSLARDTQTGANAGAAAGIATETGLEILITHGCNQTQEGCQ